MKETMTEVEKAEERRKNAERQRLSRLKKKEVLHQPPPSTSPPFKTPQVKGKVLKRARETLTGTKDQNKEVLRNLMNEYAEESPLQEKAPTRYSLPHQTVNKVKEFYHSNEISRASPNPSDYVTVIEDQQKKKISVKHLVYPVKECYGMFCTEYPDIKISLSKFFKLRPANVLSFTKTPENICVCQIHENLRCALKSLKKSHLAFANLLVDYFMHKNFVCTGASQDCFENDCEECGDGLKLKAIAEMVENPSQTVTWSKWMKTNRSDDGNKDHDGSSPYCNVEKVKKTGTIQELLSEVYDQIPDFLDHQFVKMNQAKTSEMMIQKAAQADSNSAVICCDFAEKFKCIQQNATQSAHSSSTLQHTCN